VPKQVHGREANQKVEVAVMARPECTVRHVVRASDSGMECVTAQRRW